MTISGFGVEVRLKVIHLPSLRQTAMSGLVRYPEGDDSVPHRVRMNAAGQVSIVMSAEKPINFYFGHAGDSLPMWSMHYHDPQYVASDGKVVYNINTFPYQSNDGDEQRREWDAWRNKGHTDTSQLKNNVIRVFIWLMPGKLTYRGLIRISIWPVYHTGFYRIHILGMYASS